MTTAQELIEETAQKNRGQLQAYLKGMRFVAVGTNTVLADAYLRVRRFEEGLADESELPPAAATKTTGGEPKEPDPFGDDVKRGWEYSDAKAALYACIVDGDIPAAIPDPEKGEEEDEETLWGYFNLRPEIHNYGGFDVFKRRLNALRGQIDVSINRAAEDEKAWNVYKKNHPKQTMASHGNYPEWEGSEAQKWLKKDMEQGRHETSDKQKFWESRDDYIVFPLKVFRDHIAQEIRTGKYLRQLKDKGKGNPWKDFRKDKEDESDDESEDGAEDEGII